jgi:hypothetical protein
MTILNIVERIKLTFPQASIPEILKDIDFVQKKFSEKTYILEKEGELASPSTTTEWSLPSDYLELSDSQAMELYDSNGNPQYLRDLQIWYSIDTGTIKFYSTSDSVTITDMSSVDSIYMRYKYKAPAIDEYSDSLTIDEEFHDGIESGVMERLFARYPTIPVFDGQGKLVSMRNDMSMIGYHKNEYNSATVRARQRMNSKKNTYSDLQSYPFAGKFELIRRGKLSVATTIVPVSLGYLDYLKVTCTYPSTVTIGANWGWTTTPTGAIVGNTLTLTSASSEFTESMIVEKANYSMRHSRSSATTWVFTLPSSYTNLSFCLTEPS